MLDAGAGHTNYLWSTGDTTQTIYASASGSYSVTVGNGTPVSNSNSLSFDGQDDYVEISNPNLFTNNNQISLNVWVQVNTHTFNSSVAIMSKWSDNSDPNNRPFHLQFSGGSNNIDFLVNGGSSSVNMRISDLILNQWNMLTCVYDDINGLISFYHNGILKSQNTISSGGNIYEYNNRMIIGAHTETTYEFLTGKIDNPSVWNRA